MGARLAILLWVGAAVAFCQAPATETEPPPDNIAQRFQDALWRIANQPDSALLRLGVSRFERADLSAEQYSQAVSLWESAAKSRPGDAAVLWNAAWFFEGLSPDLYLTYLEATAAADPNHRDAIR